MDSISYRKWERWKNESLLEENESFNGYFECVLTPTLMVHQTLEFLSENFQFSLDSSFSLNVINVAKPPIEIVNSIIVNQNNELCLRIYSCCKNTAFTSETISNLLRLLNQLSLKVGITLNCYKIMYFDHNLGKVFQTARKSIGRGMSFEIEERGLAFHNIIESTPISAIETVPEIKGYLTGLNLMGLEDQFPGLIEAAFMQFYIACEAACGNNELEKVKQYIADLFTDSSESKRMQIIAHHIWQVRNNYFGHATAKKTRRAENFEQSSRIVKQVLVARYLCHQLILAKHPQSKALFREIGLFIDGYAQFNGSIKQLEEEFLINYKGRKVKIYSKEDKKYNEIHELPDTPAMR